jgi:tetratricopeptide (TPR) repeat protein
VYANAGESAHAEALFRGVIARSFDEENKVWRYDALDAWETLVTHLVRGNRTQDAEAAIEEMRRQLPPRQQATALGICYEVMGRLEQAEENYRDALELRKNEPELLQRLASLYLRTDRLAQAEPVLLRLVNPLVDAPEASVAWARRQLALLRADGGGDENYREALALLAKNQADSPEDVADARALAFVKATQPENRPAALKALEESRTGVPLAPDEQFRLARLYEASKDGWPKARELMDELVTRDPMNPTYLAHHTAGLIAHANRDDARLLVERLARLEPNSDRVRRFREELQKKGP